MVFLRVKRQQPEADPNIHRAPQFRMSGAIILFPLTCLCAWNRERDILFWEGAGRGDGDFSCQHFFLDVICFAKLFRFHCHFEKTCRDFCILGSLESGWKRLWTWAKENEDYFNKPHTWNMKRIHITKRNGFQATAETAKKVRRNFLRILWYCTVKNKSFLLLKELRSVLGPTQLRSWGPSRVLSNRHSMVFHRVKVAGSWGWQVASSEVKNKWTCTSILPYTCTACTGT